MGKCKWGKGCLYINKLEDINLNMLEDLINQVKDNEWHNNNSKSNLTKKFLHLGYNIYSLN